MEPLRYQVDDRIALVSIAGVGLALVSTRPILTRATCTGRRHDLYLLPILTTYILTTYTYQGHVYCDGGMTNDFPMNALPEGPGRLGLMVR